MTSFLQLLSLLVIVSTTIVWGRWVHDTWREIKTPEHLATINLHGLSDDSTQSARSLGVGIAGQLGEHKRLVDYINSTAEATGQSDTLHAAIRVSQPAPELIRASPVPAGDLDISVEVAGNKVDASGLQKLFGTKEKRGGLSLSVLLDPSGDDKYSGLVSASFKENPVYGFALPVSGTMREITEQVAMRFVQAHYAASDPFFSALDPVDFRAFWIARRTSPDIAIRWESGGRVGSAELRTEANKAYASIEGMAKRYRARVELQKLAAYFASVAEDYDAAVTHLTAAKDGSKDTTREAQDVEWINNQIARLEADRKNAIRAVASAAQAQPTVTVPTTTAALPSDVFSVPEQAILANPDYEKLGFAMLARALLEQTPRKIPIVALILGGVEPFEPFDDRIHPASAEDKPVGDTLDRHVEDVASVIATLAPHAKVRTYSALGGKGRGDARSITNALLRAVADKPDVIALPLGPMQPELLKAISASDVLVIAAAGNSGTEPELALPHETQILFVGASEGVVRSPYSNFGSSVRLYAPGTAVTHNREGTSENRGTSFATAVAAATAANLVMVHGKLASADLKAKLLEITEPAGDIALLDPSGILVLDN